MTTATDVITRALKASGAIGQGQAPQTSDLNDAFTILNAMIVAWQVERNVLVIPGALPTYPDLTTDVTFWDGYDAAVMWGLSVRLRPMFGLAEDPDHIKLAIAAGQLLQANNKQFQPSPSWTTTTGTGYYFAYLALRAAGRITDQQDVAETSQDVTDAIFLLNEMLGEWNQDRAITVTPNTFPTVTNPATPLSLTTGVGNAIVWNLAVRLRSAFGAEDNKVQIERAAKALAAIQANNKQFQPSPAQAGNDNTGYGLVYLALRAAGRVTDMQSVTQASQDVSDGLFLLGEMLDEWQLDRAVSVTPGLLPVITDPSAPLTLAAGVRSAIIWNLAVRIRSAFGIDDNKVQITNAAKSLAVIQANNKQFQPAINAGPVTTPLQVIFLALRMAGRITDQQGVASGSQDVADAFSLLVAMLGQWQQERWLVWGLVNTALPATGANSYTVGPGGDFSQGRPTKIESAFIRLLPVAGNGQTVDFPLEIISSYDDFNMITLKNLTTIPSAVFYDAAFPLGNLFVWPVPAAGSYEIHIAARADLPSYGSLSAPLGLPAEYNEALIANLACRINLLAGASTNPELSRLAAKTLRVLRKVNLQVPAMQMPAGIPCHGWTTGGAPWWAGTAGPNAGGSAFDSGLWDVSQWST